MTQAYYRDADALLLLFDLTNPLSFHNIRSWMSDVAEYASASVRVFLIGNKVDLTQTRKISPQDAQAMADVSLLHSLSNHSTCPPCRATRSRTLRRVRNRGRMWRRSSCASQSKNS